VEVAAYRIAIEAVSNAARHANAANCDVTVKRADTQLVLTIVDDGCGLSSGHRPHVGLRTMRERALELGGTLEVRSRNPSGTVVEARLPLPRPEVGA
jgi:signal transduction histidine kinase